MRRLLTTLMILLVVLVAGLFALVMLINPNDFRAYMIHQVETRSGYQLKLDGPLRWHVWPQLSILSGRMSLTAPGASLPIVSADNMRLDAALIPLLSHQLHIRQVMLKGAVVQLTPQTKARRPQDAPVGPSGTHSVTEADRGWSFDVAKLKMVDSLLVLQHGNDEQMTVRNINLQMDQDENRKAHLEISSHINRDQRDLDLSLVADLDVSDFPHQLSADVSRIGYRLQGADLPESGITGNGSLLMRWQGQPKQVALSRLQLTANDSDLEGEIALLLHDKPEWSASLHSSHLNFDNLVAADCATCTRAPEKAQQPSGTQPRPIIADGIETGRYRNLRDLNLNLKLAANAVRWRGLTFNDVQSTLVDRSGLLVIEQLVGRLGQGRMSLPGVLDARGAESKLEFQPEVGNIDIGLILKAFNYPVQLSGQLSMQGRFTGDRLSAEAFRRSWQGDAEITMTHPGLEGMNFRQLIQQAVSRSNSGVETQQNDNNVTELNHFSATARLNNGTLALNAMKGQSDTLSLTGSGQLDLIKEQCDIAFNVLITSGWKGENRLADILKTTPFPLRVYGPWQRMSYNMQVDQVLRKRLQDEAKRRLNEWADKHQSSEKANDLSPPSDKL